MLRRRAHERIHFAEHAAQQLVGTRSCAGTQCLQQPRLAILFAAFVQSFDQAVGEDDQPVARLQDRTS